MGVRIPPGAPMIVTVSDRPSVALTNMNPPMRIRVVAGLIFRDDRILACQRHESGVFPLKWEFPGGKVKDGESEGDALRRELCEELGIVVHAAKPFFNCEHTYPAGPAVSLTFYHVTAYDGAVQNLVFQRVEWIDLTALDRLDFLEGDRPLIRQLIAGGAGAEFLAKQ